MGRQDLAAVIAEMRELGDRLAYQGEDALAIRVVRWADRLAILLAEAQQDVPPFEQAALFLEQAIRLTRVNHLMPLNAEECVQMLRAKIAQAPLAALPETSAQQECQQKDDDQSRGRTQADSRRQDLARQAHS